MAEDIDLAKSSDSKGGSKKLLILIIVIVVLLAAVGGLAAMLLLGGGDKEAAEPSGPVLAQASSGPAIYHSLEPAFIVNFREERRARMMQVRMDVLTRNPEVVTVMNEHMPMIRNNILILLSRKGYDDVISAEGKEALQGEVVEVIRQTLSPYVAPNAIEAIYFTSFVMQ